MPATANGAWAAGRRERGAAALARAVLATPGALGYLDLSEARRATLAMATLVGPNGRDVRPTSDTLSAAAADSADALLGGEEPVVLSGSTAPNTYPLTSAIVADLCTVRGRHGAPSAAARALATYVLTGGQAAMPRAWYGEVPARVRLAVLAAVSGP